MNLFPIQSRSVGRRGPCEVNEAIYMRAYEVYKKCYGPQEAMITGGCRGGFSIGEMIAFLYAYPFPEHEWRARIIEAFEGMKNFS